MQRKVLPTHVLLYSYIHREKTLQLFHKCTVNNNYSLIFSCYRIHSKSQCSRPSPSKETEERQETQNSFHKLTTDSS